MQKKGFRVGRLTFMGSYWANWTAAMTPVGIDIELCSFKARCDMSYSGANVTLISEVLKFPPFGRVTSQPRSVRVSGTLKAPNSDK